MESIFNSCLSEFKFVAYLDEIYCRFKSDAIIIFANPSKVCCYKTLLMTPIGDYLMRMTFGMGSFWSVE